MTFKELLRREALAAAAERGMQSAPSTTAPVKSAGTRDDHGFARNETRVRAKSSWDAPGA